MAGSSPQFFSSVHLQNVPCLRTTMTDATWSHRLPAGEPKIAWYIVIYLARFLSCLIEKGLDKVEICEKNCEYLPVELTWGPGWISVEFWAITFLPSVDLVSTAWPGVQGLHWPLHKCWEWLLTYLKVQSLYLFPRSKHNHHLQLILYHDITIIPYWMHPLYLFCRKFLVCHTLKFIKQEMLITLTNGYFHIQCSAPAGRHWLTLTTTQRKKVLIFTMKLWTMKNIPSR
jgi:hypothetical protein